MKIQQSSRPVCNHHNISQNSLESHLIDILIFTE